MAIEDGRAAGRRADDPARTPEADEAVSLWERGLRPVPLRPIGRDGGDGKAPIGPDWAARTFADEAEIRGIYRANPGAGVGLALGLGPDGGAGPVDLEVDDPGAAAATLRAIFGAAGPPPTAGWASPRGEHRIYLMAPGDARRLLDAGVSSATLDGRHHPCLAGLELRLGTLDPARPRQVQSAAPPTRTLPKDGSAPRRRRYLDPDAGFAPLPGALVDHVIEHLGARPAAGPAAVPGRDGLAGLVPLDKFRAQLAKAGIGWTPCGEGFACRCPAHPDGRPSLTFREGDDGRLLAHCHRGCGFAEVASALNLRPIELSYYPAGAPAGPARAPARPGREVPEEQRARLAYMHRLAFEAIEAEPARLEALAERLGLPAAALLRLDVGWREDVEPDGEGGWSGTGRWAWVFPECDGRAEIVGLLRRYEDPALGKRLVRGGRRGLTIPSGWRELPGPIHVVEGVSDVAAMLAAGLAAVGRPNNRAGAGDLAVLLAGDPREVVVLGERDALPDGSWPGDPAPFARALSRALGRPVATRLPPAPFKDVRAFVAARLAAGGATS